MRQMYKAGTKVRVVSVADRFGREYVRGPHTHKLGDVIILEDDVVSAFRPPGCVYLSASEKPLNRTLTRRDISYLGSYAVIEEIQEATGIRVDLVDAPAAIAAECDAIKSLLIAKNEAYGNSALAPIGIFSGGSSIEQIKVRIDDKLSRLKRGKNTDKVPEDTLGDLIGYLIMLRIAQKGVK
jgi:hypothetical protein